MMTGTMPGKRVLGLTISILLAVAGIIAVLALRAPQAGAAGRHDHAYPPKGPTSVSSSSCKHNGGSNGGSSGKQCNVGPTEVSSTPAGSSSSAPGHLASTGFDSAMALVVVVLLVGGGTLLVFAGRRGRRA